MKPILKTDYRKKRTTVRIEFAREVLQRALATPKLVRRLDDFGYGTPMLLEGIALVEQAAASRGGLLMEPSPGAVPPDEVPRLLEGAIEEGRELHRVARLAFARNRTAREQLELAFPFPNTRFLMLQVLERLAHTLLLEKKFQQVLARHGLTASKVELVARRLSAARVLAFEWHQATDQREKMASIARRNLALLDRWMSDFFMVAKVALMDDSRALAAVGVTVVARTPQKRG